jgi:hypothetical protein
VCPQPGEPPLPGELAHRLPVPGSELDPAGPTSPGPGGVLAEDLAALALDLVRARSAEETLAVTAVLVVGLVAGASEAVASVLRRGEVELTSATGPEAESCEAWQLATGSGPAVEAVEVGGTVLVHDLTNDTRWPPLHAVAEHDDLASVLSVAAPLPASGRTLLLSWYAVERQAFASPACTRSALLVAAHASLALDRALHEVDLRRAVVSGQEVGRAVGLLAATRSVGVEEAFALLRAESQRTNQRLADLARRIVDEHG